MPGDPCAYWLPKDVSDEFCSPHAQNLDGLIKALERATPVPATQHDGISSVLMGDLFTVLTCAGVEKFPAMTVLDDGPVLLKMTPGEAKELDDELGRYIAKRSYESIATDQYMFLFHGETGTVRAGIEYLRTALRIPQGYEAVLLHLA